MICWPLLTRLNSRVASIGRLKRTKITLRIPQLSETLGLKHEHLFSPDAKRTLFYYEPIMNIHSSARLTHNMNAAFKLAEPYFQVPLSPQFRIYVFRETIKINAWNRGDMQCRNYNHHSQNQGYISQDLCITQEFNTHVKHCENSTQILNSYPVIPLLSTIPEDQNQKSRLLPCDKNKTEIIFALIERNCLQDCELIDYETLDHEVSKIYNGIWEKTKTETRINFWRSPLPAIKVIYRAKMTWIEFISQVGGIVGIWLGISIYGFHEYLIGLREMMLKSWRILKQGFNHSRTFKKQQQRPAPIRAIAHCPPSQPLIIIRTLPSAPSRPIFIRPVMRRWKRSTFSHQG